ncbi:hypothetical protein D7V67_16540 [Clostridium paraputrificum]|uniref:type II toxin-antitoxin system RnlA family toxin n=1 Tax=Clostridium paraputrificum TaxID=29363 RepID=UPI000EA378B3|nr:type II toxin-antitoxin system RnlA family toxin [Clostridium paraputrificum]RKI45315.1 hypothetical protein D7V67_16540 [Clostridium paraputrificum]
MGKYTKLLLDKSLIKSNIDEYFVESGTEFTMEEPKLINESTGQTRYQIKVDNKTIIIDFFFRSDKTTTIQPTGNAESKELGAKIAEYIVDKNNCVGIKKGVTTIENISEDQFNHLKNYLKSIPGVNVLDENRNVNGCGHLYKINNEIGDKITLTYYNKNGKLLCQGSMFKLYMETTCFLNGLGFKLNQKVDGQSIKEDDKIENIVKKLLPQSYNKIDRIFVDFIYDSYAQIEYNIKCKDYSVYTFAALKGLEGFIKQILLKNKIRLNDKLGFSIKVSNKDVRPLFIKKSNKYFLDTSLVTDLGVCEINALEDTYRFYNKYRHTLFHTKQAIVTTAKITNASDAEKIVNDVCIFFEKYYELIV